METAIATKNLSVIDRAKFTSDDLVKIEEIRKGINTEDSGEIITYGVSAQREIADFSDGILSEVRSKDTGYVGTIMTDLVVNIRGLEVDKLGSGKGFLESLPLVGGLIDSVKRFIAKYDKLSVQIEKILDELEKARMNLMRDITMLDTMYEKNLSYLKNLDLFIVAGEDKLKEMNEILLPELKKRAESSNDPVDAQKFHDFGQMITRFEKKLHDLKLSRMIAIQTAPQVRLIQNANSTLVEKIQSSIMNTIPLWKNQMVIAITLFRQGKAVEMQKQVTDMTNELLTKNAEMLKDTSLKVARESERGIVEIDTLKKLNADLISTIEETLKIQKDGKLKRQQAEGELVKLETELKAKLKEVKSGR